VHSAADIPTPSAHTTPRAIDVCDHQLKLAILAVAYALHISMNMNGMQMGGHHGHDMGSMTMSGGMFTPTDKSIARKYWYIIAGCTLGLSMIRLASYVQASIRLRRCQKDGRQRATVCRNWLAQTYATATAILREVSHPQPLYFTGQFSKCLTPPTLGRCLVLTTYWIMILIFLWSDTILTKGDPLYAYKWEKVGFRAAWVTVTQIPFVYMLSCKFNIISIFTGVSYERLNWLHRWVARTVWLTALIHWSFFYTEWSIANIVSFQLGFMPMIKYGFGAWGVLTWMLLSGFGMFRNLCYELFVLQHIAAAGTLLWLLFVHVPSYAKYNIWMAVGFLALDWGSRIIMGALRNMHLLSGSMNMKAPGHVTRLEALPGRVVRLTIDDADFSWKAGQHVRLVVPRLRPFEAHPFTIANASYNNDDGRPLTLLIQARSGFTKSLYNFAVKTEGTKTCRTLISGPWGSPPALSHYETVVLIGCATGASFIVPLLQAAIKKPGCIRRIVFHWIIREDIHFGWFAKELQLVRDQAQEVEIHIHVTGTSVIFATEDVIDNSKDAPKVSATFVHSLSMDSDSPRSIRSIDSENLPLNGASEGPREQFSRSLLKKHRGRPTLDSMIRPAVERATGETAVIVCGGVSITAESRNYVAALSDQRAVHKGTGAQGIFLFTETYS
jgi:NAD(P)H-flavin reductase